MKVAKLTVNSYTGENRKPHGGFVSFDDGKSYGWGFAPERDEVQGKWVMSSKITLSGSKKMSVGSTTRVFYSAKREAAIKEFLENNY